MKHLWHASPILFESSTPWQASISVQDLRIALVKIQMEMQAQIIDPHKARPRVLYMVEYGPHEMGRVGYPGSCKNIKRSSDVCSCGDTPSLPEFER
jgi:hypothetical protein